MRKCIYRVGVYKCRNCGIWQLIDTAPKDGTRIILYRPSQEDETPVIGRWERPASGQRRGQWDYPYENNYKPHPTHWMPLPEPPTE